MAACVETASTNQTAAHLSASRVWIAEAGTHRCLSPLCQCRGKCIGIALSRSQRTDGVSIIPTLRFVEPCWWHESGHVVDTLPPGVCWSLRPPIAKLCSARNQWVGFAGWGCPARCCRSESVLRRNGRFMAESLPLRSKYGHYFS